MATLNTGAGSGTGRRSVDAELALVPMIDLLVCCITFLLLTAAWSLMHRLPVDSHSQTRTNGCDCDVPRPRLTVQMQASPDEPFRLTWKQGTAVLSTVEVPRTPVVVERNGQRVVTYPGLRAAMEREWRARGHDEAGPHDVAILETPDATSFGEMTAVMDAVYGVSRSGKQAGPAFALQLGR